MEYTAQNLEYAVSVFYNGEQAERTKAHSWLTTAQRAPEAWNFVWELMQPTKGTEIQFYAATTLHTKILRCWNEVPEESYEELKQKLLQAVIGYAKGPIIVTNRLCISLAAFILQQGSKDLAEILRPLSTPENASLLLEVLTVIPEEYTSMTMRTALRSKNRAALNQASHMVLDDMLRCLQTAFNDYSKEPPNEATILSWTNAANCAASWLNMDGEDSLESGATTLPERLTLCRALLTAVHVLYTWSSQCSDGAVETCEACLQCVRAAATTGAADRYPAAALQLMADLAALADRVLQTPLDIDAPDWINEELVTALVTCCVATCECHTRALVLAVEGVESDAAGGGAARLLQLMLAAQAAPGHYPLHETRSNLLFSVWYTLQDEILNMADGKSKINPIWQDVFTQLLLALIKKSEMPAESALSRDDQELLRCYRQDVSDAVMYCFSILGDRCWEVTAGAYTAANTEASREAALHVFASLADAAPHGRYPPPLPALLQHSLRVAATPQANPRALPTALECLGSYASWLGSLEGEEGGAAAALAGACVRAAGAALPHSPAAAALALRKLCADCSAPAAALAADIVHVTQNADVGRDLWTRRQLLSAAGAALAASELTRAAPLLRTLADQLAAELTQQANSRGRGAGCGAAEGCVALMGALAPAPALAADLLRALLPALALLPQHQRLVEPMFNILKHTLSSLMGDCLPMINEIGELTVAGFTLHPCPAGLDVVKLIVLFAADEWGGACNVTRECVCAAARTLAADAAAAPDLADALYTLLLALTRKKPHTLDWINPVLHDLVNLACECVRVWESGGARAACGWLAALATRRANALRPAAPALAHQAICTIGGAAPRAQLEALTELLLALNRAQWVEVKEGEGLGTWLAAALAPPGFPTAHATPAHKNKFLTNVIKERSSKRRLLETVQEFSLACRGLIDTEYARQTLAAKSIVA
ncbi:importin-13 [Aricia agestis]|uniref:importin-13 n=1 Tax=Aricia agestis TaxID=91739 RepID=UPI001C204D3E|nr:importin-13 [Aricia agestis]